MFLSDLIRLLEKYPADKAVARGFDDPHSYRGYYERLAFEPKSNTTIGAILKAAKSALGQTFSGYKGGEYKMDAFTDCYIAEYGCEGEELSELLLEYLLNDTRPWPSDK